MMRGHQYFACLVVIVVTSCVDSQGLKLEPVSARLKRELIHPDKTAWLTDVRFSPDGKQVMARDSGGVQIWEAATGKQLIRIETGEKEASVRDFFLAPDWKTLSILRAITDTEEGKKPDYVDVRTWDLATGRLRDTHKYAPPGRFVRRMAISPDGTSFVTLEFSFDGSETRRNASLWDARSKRFRPLPGVFSRQLPHGNAIYSPDSKLLAAPIGIDNGRAGVVQVFDVATAKLKASMSTRAESTNEFECLVFAADSRRLIGWVFNRDKQRELKLWDPSTGQELDSFVGDQNDIFAWAAFHLAYPIDAHLLAASILSIHLDGKLDGKKLEGKLHGKLVLFDISRDRLAKRFVLNMKGAVGEPVFSPDGKWIAAPTQVMPADALMKEYQAEELPQPRIHLIDSATGAIRETLVAPQGSVSAGPFSPDGRTFATTSRGRVLLFDLSTPPIKVNGGIEKMRP